MAKPQLGRGLQRLLGKEMSLEELANLSKPSAAVPPSDPLGSKENPETPPNPAPVLGSSGDSQQQVREMPGPENDSSPVAPPSVTSTPGTHDLTTSSDKPTKTTRRTTRSSSPKLQRGLTTDILVLRAVNAALVILEKQRALEFELLRINATLGFIQMLSEQPCVTAQNYAKTK